MHAATYRLRARLHTLLLRHGQGGTTLAAPRASSLSLTVCVVAQGLTVCVVAQGLTLCFVAQGLTSCFVAHLVRSLTPRALSTSTEARSERTDTASNHPVHTLRRRAAVHMLAPDLSTCAKIRSASPRPWRRRR